jgi:hypothetical protein
LRRDGGGGTLRPEPETAMAAFTFNAVPSIVFGPGCIARIGENAALLGPRAARVTDAGLVRAGLVAVERADARAIYEAAW